MWLVALPAELITRRLCCAVWFYMPCYVMIIELIYVVFSFRCGYLSQIDCIRLAVFIVCEVDTAFSYCSESIVNAVTDA